MKKKRPASLAHAPRRTVDSDGVVRVELGQGGGALLPRALALIALAAVVGLALWLFRGRGRSHEGAPSASNAAAQSSARASSAPPRAFLPRSGALPSSPAAAPEATAQAEEAGEAPDEERHEAPGKSGIYVFPAPGTKRIKAGLVVPEDFPLPPGYVRHYQATDKGQMLEAVLMFHPDYHPVDAQGQPIPIPEDRVVPPEMAPPGLPLRRLEVPKDAYADPEAERKAAIEQGVLPPEDDSADPAP